MSLEEVRPQMVSGSRCQRQFPSAPTQADSMLPKIIQWSIDPHLPKHIIVE